MQTNSKNMTKARFKRILAFFLAINIFFEVVSPTVAMALTSGPTQPEMSSFEPVGTTEMVDVFSGDFNYNIPLMNVPGPNGSYPINLAYHAGIGMEDEASWVGLGWNINPGSVTRQMRGLPDDFNGDPIKREMHMRPNRTVGLSYAFPLASAEIWGFKIQQNMALGMVWNNYQGIGFNGSFNASASKKSQSEKAIQNGGFNASVNLNYNSLAGETTMTPAFSFSGKSNSASSKFGVSASISSLSGLKDLNYSVNVSRTKSHSQKEQTGNYNFSEVEGKLVMTPEYETVKYRVQAGSYATSGSFASPGFAPSSVLPQTGTNISAMFSIGGDFFGIYGNMIVNADYDLTKNERDEQEFKGYGYLNSENTKTFSSTEDDDNYKLMDFNREKEAALSKDVPNMPVPVYTHDMFMVKGQGTGGAFRAYRNDISLLRDAEVNSNIFGGAIGLEAGAGYPTFNLGVNASLNYSRSYSGPWKSKDMYQGVYDKTYLNAGYYFKSPGDICASVADELGMISVHDKFPVSRMFNMPGYTSVDDAESLAEVFNPFADFTISDNGIFDQTSYNTKRARSQFMSYRTVSEIQDIPEYKQAWVDGSVTNLSYSNSLPGHHIGEISVTNPDGNRYIYALPVVNQKQTESTFSIENEPSQVGGKITNYGIGDGNNNGDNSVKNTKLDDHFYSATTLPPYAHDYLLTAIVAPDYVDLTGNGPSDDDFGYWVKLKYDRTSTNYRWRMPFYGANLMKGYLSTDNDDKAGLTYGEKEIWYVSSIETKTHIAKFTTENRKDGHGAVNVNEKYDLHAHTDNLPNGTLKLLRKISLFSKKDLVVPVKEVNFGYTYSLCEGTWNNENYGSALSDRGKLTLTKVSFSYQGNTRASLSPYMFTYSAQNPNYEPSHGDRWGNYQADKYSVNNTLYPYTFQKADYNEDGNENAADDLDRNNAASAWNLREITLPSGGKIKVSYEADDYAYVHAKTAMEMVKIVGFGEGANGFSVSHQHKMSKNNDYLYFELDKQTMDASDVAKMIEGIDDMYFNVYTNLKKNGIEGIPKSDYVNGYAKIDKNSYGVYDYALTGKRYGYVRVVPVTVRDRGNGPETHPFRKAGWQYLKLERKDVLFPGSSASNSNGGGGIPFLKQVANATIGAFQSSGQLFMGYYNFCATAGYCSEMDPAKPSFIRLNISDGIKYGGGHRVSRLEVSDTWQETKNGNEAVSVYGQEYDYRMPDGTSSGVASYEPLIGGEEIPYRKPIRYSSPYFIFKNQNLYMEEPVGESYYPGAGVGYSRVTVKSIENTNVSKRKEGKTVYEFYTTKDFPFVIIRTPMEQESFKPKFPIPFIGNVSFNNYAFSQAMEVNTNDMHGRAKSVATYNAFANLLDPQTLPVTKTDFMYNTVNPYTPSGANHLNSEFDCLFNDGIVRKAEMGATHENFIDMKQNSSVYMKQGLQTNLDLTFIAYVPVPVFTAMPIIDYAESMFKSVVKMQVHSQTAVLMETRVFNEGSSVSTKNLMFDANSGKALLTTVTNDFDKPIYTYNYSAAWAYKELGNAYKNDRESFGFTTNASDVTLIGGAAGKANDLFCKGDQVLVNSGSTKTKCWVTNILNPNTVQLLKEDGNPYTAGGTCSGYIIQSGYKNQQAISNGFIVSLTNPVTDRLNYFFDGVPQVSGPNIGGYNMDVYNPVTSSPGSVNFSVTDCNNTSVTKMYRAYTSFNSNNKKIIIEPAENDCDIVITFPLSSAINLSNWQNYKLEKVGNEIHATQGSSTIIATLFDGCGITSCLDGVLQASASQFKPDWTYDYRDVGNPVVKYASSSSTSSISTVVAGTHNPYRIGTDGIWRMEKTWAYQAPRKQSPVSSTTNTKIREDGTFEHFTLFDWGAGNPANKNKSWTNVNTVTKYNPYGFEVENKDAISVYSSALYGYSNSLQTAITANSAYYETGFDGFEDYTAGSVSTTDHGHIKLLPNSGNFSIVSGTAHTGAQSIEIGASQNVGLIGSGLSTNFYFRPVATANKKYFVSAWFKAAAGKPAITFQNVVSGSTNVYYSDVTIEGWQKIEASFICTSGLNPVIYFANSNPSGNFYLDDIRIQPFKSTMKTFVYNPKTLWLVAELDNQNYATFYNYDEGGTLTQVKKETVKGVQTLKTTRSHITKNPDYAQ
jgi:hypothetical protein